MSSSQSCRHGVWNNDFLLVLVLFVLLVIVGTVVN
ncbi:YjcZ family sporulation protein [Calditerricola satsumensis]|nr:YjcZ family sporulation protein [Calditerricola satsumensis]